MRSYPHTHYYAAKKWRVNDVSTLEKYPFLRIQTRWISLFEIPPLADLASFSFRVPANNVAIAEDNANHGITEIGL